MMILSLHENLMNIKYPLLKFVQQSPIPKLLTHSSNSVTKLTDRKIRWIIREKMKEILSTNDIALLPISVLVFLKSAIPIWMRSG
ncbi:MAG: hypothetical protein WBF33_27765 [Candidatus Nitrosopolaris sp.]